jgi:hypothetical protein
MKRTGVCCACEGNEVFIKVYLYNLEGMTWKI